MSSHPTPTRSNPAPLAHLPRRLAVCTVLAGLLAISTALQAQYYDFDSGTDTGWLMSTHPKTVTFPTDALGGYAYRLQGTPQTTGSDTNARVFSYITNRMYTNFYAAVDVVAWNTNQDCEQIIGLIARANNNPALGNTIFDPDAPNGLTFNIRLHDYRDYTGPTNNGPLGSSDQMSMWSMINVGYASLGQPVAVTAGNPPTASFRWVPGHAYRLVLSSTNIVGDPKQWFTASIYDVNDLSMPLFTMTGDDSYPGNSVYIPSYGYAGIVAYKLAGSVASPTPDYDPSVDVTFDNFYVAEGPPASVAAPAIPHGKISAPQVVNRVPVSYKNFHPAASGITFNATTLTTTNTINTAASKLYLNGVDVSAGLIISGPATNASVSYFGLATNVVYDASIVLQDALGRRTTNQWTFDTFSDAYLASSAVRVIEAEDYDFNDGQFIDDPAASGYYNYNPLDESGSMVNYGLGYVEQIGSNARTGGSDFFDYDTGLHQYENQYRHSDSVGTQQGNFGDLVNANDTQYQYSQTYDTQRSKYFSVNATLQEYIVERTEGGEWLNYTRVFDGTKSYNAYLRAGCGLAQPVRLDQIIGIDPSATTNILGWFNVPSTSYNEHYRYTPLVATNGALAVVNLSGTNTVRLTIDSTQNRATRNGLAMNYMVFVPAAPQLPPQLYSSATVDGSYAPEPAALWDAGKKQFSISQQGDMRFYRIGWNTQVSITGISLTGGNVVLSYQ
jgi:hypothetical protein